MPLIHTRSRLAVLAAAALVAALSACSGDDDPTGDDTEASVVGAWQAASFTALGTDYIDLGMSLTAVLGADNTYDFTVINDLVGICGGDGGENCSTTGAYATSAGQITIDPGDEDEVTFSYSIQGSGMSWTGSVGGTPAVVTWVRTN